ncbi:MAG: UvrD-helicase domain-containing protein [Candidatus Omnitrophota bacterium]|nr:UvrD-helicase domain-containing protein [Candidatus Omnitrophota bacterium]
MDQENCNSGMVSQVCIVEASAGSGKTYALAKRYVALLINSSVNINENYLKNILAITFTNKATVEMKERILDFLKRIALEEFNNKAQEQDILSVLTVDKKTAGAKASFIMDELIKNYNFFQVKTIDSFINSLLLGCALQIQRSASFRIGKEYKDCLSYCFDLVMEEAASNKEIKTAMEEFLQHYLFVENKQGWFPKEDILGLMASLFRLSNKYGCFFSVYKGSSVDVIIKRKQIYNQIKELSGSFPDGMNGRLKNSIVAFLNKNSYVFNIGSLPKGLNTPDVPMNKGKEAPSDFEDKWASIYKELGCFVELDATVAYNPYVKLFSWIFDSFQEESKKEDILFMEELNKQARRLFDEEGVTVAEVYYRLAARFRHFLIDEFQDTSMLQWHNLEMMVEDALSGGGSLFYVGDRKQAIYRFRGGEAKLFDDVRDKFSHFNINHQRLTKNWRSQKAIVEFNNKIFSEDNLSRALTLSGISQDVGGDTDEILEIFKNPTQVYRQDNDRGYVQVKHIDEQNKKERDEIVKKEVLSSISELHSRFHQYRDLAVLVNDNNEAEEISIWLLEAGVPVESEKTLNIIENPLIKEIIALLKFLYSPIDDLSFAAFVLGRVFTKASGVSSEQISDFIFSLRKNKKLNSGVSLYRLFRNEFTGIWEEYFETFLKTIGFISPYELLMAIYQRFKVLDNFSDNQGFFMKLLELIKIKEDDCLGLGEFISYLENAPSAELYVSITRQDSVKVLTIHKSKGLEFGCVIIPFLRMEINPETGGKGTASYVTEAGDGRLGLVRITQNHRLYSESLRRIYVENYKKACIDELNKVYVALTRAKYELYVFIPKKSAKGNNVVRFLIPEDISSVGSKQKYKHKEHVGNSLINIKPGQYKDWIGQLRSEFGDVNVVKSRNKIIQGVVFHFILSCIDNMSSLGKKEMITAAVKRAVDLYPEVDNLFSWEKKIGALLEAEMIKPFFYVEKGIIYREKEIVNIYGDTRRIDRLIVKEKEVWVIDYKLTDDFCDKYRKQVKEYMDIVKDIYPGREVKGFILYIEEIRVEEVWNV